MLNGINFQPCQIITSGRIKIFDYDCTKSYYFTNSLGIYIGDFATVVPVSIGNHLLGILSENHDPASEITPLACHQLYRPHPQPVTNILLQTTPIARHLATQTTPIARHLATQTTPIARHLAIQTTPIARHQATLTTPIARHLATQTTPIARHLATLTTPIARHLATLTTPIARHLATLTTPKLNTYCVWILHLQLITDGCFPSHMIVV